MERSSEELAVNKLYILYILQQMDLPLTNAQITNLFMENDLLDYFSLQQYFHELKEAGLIGSLKKDGLSHYMISEKGSIALKYFHSRLSPAIMDSIQTQITQKREALLRQREITTAIRENKEGDFGVNLKILDYDTPYINIDIKVPTAKTARIICENWKNNASDIYGHLMDTLIRPSRRKKNKR